MSANLRSRPTAWLRSCPLPVKPGPSTWNVDRSRLAPKSLPEEPDLLVRLVEDVVSRR